MRRNIDRVCLIAIAAAVAVTGLYLCAVSFGLIGAKSSSGYKTKLFDQSRVHTMDIVMEDWDSFLETCQNEEYAACTVSIDGEPQGSVAIRAKGNTSLSSVAQHGNNRYSFKLEFDQYEAGKSYYGLDKLSLNNLIQDKTYLKDYMAYTLMNQMDAAAPLCSFVQITVNGEDWGLYLAVEGVEESFLERNYGADYGELYKPDSLSFGGGRGQGKDFDMNEFAERFADSGPDSESAQDNASPASEVPAMPGGGFDPPSMFGEGFTPPDLNGEGFDPFAMSDEGFSPPAMPGESFDPSAVFSEGFEPPAMSGEGFTPPSMPDGFQGGPGMGGMGDSDVRLQYTDDNPESYPNIWNGAKTDITGVDQQRLIASLKKLSDGQDIETVVDVDAVIRYLVVHNFMCNDDSYTGMMVHNYYLYEEDGRLSMIPWDYNLSLGGFSMGGRGTASGATSTVNSPIDSPVSGGSIASRPMVSWIFSDEQYTKQYHDVYAEFLDTVFFSGWFETHMRSVMDMIAPYVQRDENGFFSYNEFVQGCDTLLEFCSLRAQSITGQLDGSIPSTTEGQRTDASALIDASHLELSDMGEFGMGGGGFLGGPDEGGFEMSGSFGASRRGGKRGERNPAAQQGTDQTPSSETGTDKRDFDRSKMPDSFGGFPGRPDGEAPDAARDSSGATMLVLCIASLLAAMVCVKRCKPHQ